MFRFLWQEFILAEAKNEFWLRIEKALLRYLDNPLISVNVNFAEMCLVLKLLAFFCSKVQILEICLRKSYVLL